MHKARGRKAATGKREQILEAATATFMDRDYSQVTMEEIAEAAGVGKGTVYEYFESKEDLFISCFTAKIVSFMDLHAASTSRTGDVLQDLRHLLYSQHRFTIDNWRWIRLFFNERPMQVKKLEEWMLEQRKILLEQLEEVMRNGVDQGVLRADLDTKLAARCFNAMQFAALGGMMVLDGEEISKDTLDNLLDLFFKGVGAHA